jgi:hypothetical protein
MLASAVVFPNSGEQQDYRKKKYTNQGIKCSGTIRVRRSQPHVLYVTSLLIIPSKHLHIYMTIYYYRYLEPLVMPLIKKIGYT